MAYYRMKLDKYTIYRIIHTNVTLRHTNQHFLGKNTINISGSIYATYQDQMSERCQWNQNYFYNEGSLGSLYSKVIFLSLTMRVQMSTWQFSVSSLNILYRLINVFYTSINTQTPSNYHSAPLDDWGLYYSFTKPLRCLKAEKLRV